LVIHLKFLREFSKEYLYQHGSVVEKSGHAVTDCAGQHRRTPILLVANLKLISLETVRQVLKIMVAPSPIRIMS
jgi:hypothetical protein